MIAQVGIALERLAKEGLGRAVLARPVAGGVEQHGERIADAGIVVHDRYRGRCVTGEGFHGWAV